MALSDYSQIQNPCLTENHNNFWHSALISTRFCIMFLDLTQLYRTKNKRPYRLGVRKRHVFSLFFVNYWAQCFSQQSPFGGDIKTKDINLSLSIVACFEKTKGRVCVFKVKVMSPYRRTTEKIAHAMPVRGVPRKNSAQGKHWNCAPVQTFWPIIQTTVFMCPADTLVKDTQARVNVYVTVEIRIQGNSEFH